VDQKECWLIAGGVDSPFVFSVFVEELQEIAGFSRDIEKSRAEAKQLLKEAGAEGLSFELLNRNVDQPYKYNGTWVIDQWSKIGLHVTRRVVPTGPWFDAMRRGDVTLEGNCNDVPNPPLDVQKYLPRSVFTENYGNFEDQREIELLEDVACDRPGEAAPPDARLRKLRTR
jgi:peptide/nickel transport system substrate-binding protein